MWQDYAGIRRRLANVRKDRARAAVRSGDQARELTFAVSAWLASSSFERTGAISAFGQEQPVASLMSFYLERSSAQKTSPAEAGPVEPLRLLNSTSDSTCAARRRRAAEGLTPVVLRVGFLYSQPLRGGGKKLTTTENQQFASAGTFFAAQCLSRLCDRRARLAGNQGQDVAGRGIKQ